MENIIIEWILSIAGIIFGGGMFGQFIMFIIKRQDEFKANKQKIYKQLYDKLYSYQSLLENVLLDFFKHTSNSIDVFDIESNKIRQYMDETKNLIKQIKSNYKKCKNSFVYNSERCEQCQNMKARVAELFQIIDKEIENAELTTQDVDNYWTINKEYLCKIINENLNVHAIQHLVGKKDKKLSSIIEKIDTQTLHLYRRLLRVKGEEYDFQLLIVNQIDNIEKCLNILSNKFK